jgi:hypothetical protein
MGIQTTAMAPPSSRRFSHHPVQASEASTFLHTAANAGRSLRPRPLRQEARSLACLPARPLTLPLVDVHVGSPADGIPAIAGCADFASPSALTTSWLLCLGDGQFRSWRARLPGWFAG